MSIVGLLVVLIFVGVALYLVRLIPMDATISKVITVLVVLAVILWVLEGFGLLTGYSHPIRFRA